MSTNGFLGGPPTEAAVALAMASVEYAVTAMKGALDEMAGQFLTAIAERDEAIAERDRARAVAMALEEACSSPAIATQTGQVNATPERCGALQATGARCWRDASHNHDVSESGMHDWGGVTPDGAARHRRWEKVGGSPQTFEVTTRSTWRALSDAEQDPNLVTALDAAKFLAEHARPLILQRAIPESCILSTCVAVRFCQQVGVFARAQCVSVMAANHDAWEALVAGVDLPDWPEGAHSVGTFPGIPSTSRLPGWNGGHLVAIIGQPDDAYLLDLAADQFARPDRAIEISGPLHATWDGSGVHLCSASTGTHVDYRVAPEDLSYRHAPDWNRGRWRTFVDALLPLWAAR